jgi:hypothetical protein
MSGFERTKWPDPRDRTFEQARSYRLSRHPSLELLSKNRNDQSANEGHSFEDRLLETAGWYETEPFAAIIANSHKPLVREGPRLDLARDPDLCSGFQCH